MKKKLFILSICIVFVIVAVSFSTATNIQKKEKKARISPLYKIRTSIAIGEKLQEIKNNIIEKFKQRLFVIPFFVQKEKYDSYNQGRTDWETCICTSSDTCKCNINLYNFAQQGRTDFVTCLCKI